MPGNNVNGYSIWSKFFDVSRKINRGEEEEEEERENGEKTLFTEKSRSTCNLDLLLDGNIIYSFISSHEWTKTNGTTQGWDCLCAG